MMFGIFCLFVCFIFTFTFNSIYSTEHLLIFNWSTHLGTKLKYIQEKEKK